MSKYRVTVPFQDDMGSISPFVATSSHMETAQENALWEINSMRDHDGLPRLDKMPKGTQYELISY